jgi:hypothetical protein
MFGEDSVRSSLFIVMLQNVETLDFPISIAASARKLLNAYILVECLGL